MTVTDASLPVGLADEDWTGDAEYREYTRAANPVGRQTPLVPVETFPAALHRDAPTGVVPLDLSTALGIDGHPATSPALLASFATVRAGDELVTEPRATSELYVVMAGAGTSTVDGRELPWQEGDVFVLPGGCHSVHRATADATFYWVTDEPLLRYLGVTPTERRLRPTMWPAARNAEEGGSLTILATALVETGSRMDEYIFEEFKGTGNMELRLSRRLAERRVFPAIDVDASSTRHEELLFERRQVAQVSTLRKVLGGVKDDAAKQGESDPEVRALELLLDRLKTFKTNAEFLDEVGKAKATS